MWKLYQRIWKEETIPKDWEYNVVISLHKKGDTTNCDNYRAICLAPVALKIYTRILERKLRALVEDDLEEEQVACRPGRQTQDQIYVIRILGEKLLEKGRKLNLAFLDLSSAFDRVPRDEIWRIMRKRGVNKKLTRVIESTYKSVKGLVRLMGQNQKNLKCQKE